MNRSPKIIFLASVILFSLLAVLWLMADDEARGGLLADEPRNERPPVPEGQARPDAEPAAHPEGTDPARASQPSPGRLSIIAKVGPEIRWTGDTPSAYAARAVDIATDILQLGDQPLAVGTELALETVDGKAILARVLASEVWSDGTHGVRAERTDEAGGWLVFSQSGGRVRLLTQDGVGHRITQLRYDTKRKTHVLLDVDPVGSSRLACGHTEAEHAVGNLAAGPGTAGPEAEVLADTVASGGAAAAELSGVPSDSGSVADILVLYTPAALAYEGSIENIRLNASQSILLSNQVLVDSGVDLRFNLVQTLEIDYTETSRATTDLRRLTEIDGLADQVHDLRDHYAADFVLTLGNLSTAGGVAWRPTGYDRPDWAFSLVRVQQSDTTAYTTIHELGHNMGNGHSKTQRKAPYNGDFVSYAAGWQWADESSPALIGYCSVMTYENFNGFGGDEFLRIGQFSNPDITYNGEPTGDPIHGDAARVIREGTAAYTRFREPVAASVYSDFPYSYDFEPGEVRWRQSIDDTHRWTLSQATGTPSSGTGPGGAASGGHYAYVEASFNYGATAAIEADFDFSQLNAPLLSLYFHMYDFSQNSMGGLTLQASTDGGLSWADFWSVEGNQGSEWQSATVDLADLAGAGAVRLRFMARIGANYQSDIAIDRIQIEDAPPLDPAVGFATWIEETYPTIDDADPEADPDGDGLSNFVEYAMGTNPMSPTRERPLSVQYDPSSKSLICTFRRGRAAVRYRLISTVDLDDWASGLVEWDSQTAPDLVEIGAVQSVEVEALPPRKFIRLDLSE